MDLRACVRVCMYVVRSLYTHKQSVDSSDQVLSINKYLNAISSFSIDVN